MVLEIHKFMLNTAGKVTGIYTLRSEEFNLFKHKLRISGAATDKLFFMMRHQKRSLCWRQFRDYFKFLLATKYRIQFAIKKAAKREDECISREALQGELGISRHDEAVWLFQKVEKAHDTKLTWKQITEYLQKTQSFKDNIRDFFEDKKRDQDYEEQKAEKFMKLMNRQRDIMGALTKINEHHGLEGDPVDALRTVFARHSRSDDGSSSERLLSFGEFRRVMIREYNIDIKTLNLKQIWKYLMLEQNTEMNANVNTQKCDGLKVNFLISRMKQNVKNHSNLTPRQILELAFMEFRINACSSSRELGGGTINMSVLWQQMQNVQKQMMQQNQMLLREMQDLKSKIAENGHGRGI